MNITCVLQICNGSKGTRKENLLFAGTVSYSPRIKINEIMNVQDKMTYRRHIYIVVDMSKCKRKRLER